MNNLNKRKRPSKTSTMSLIHCFVEWHKTYIRPTLKNGMTSFEHKNFPVK